MAATLLRRGPFAHTTRHTTARFTAVSKMSRSQSTFSSYLVTPSELDHALKSNAPTKMSTAPKTIPICGSWFLPNDPEQRTGYGSFTQRHIPGSRFFDLDKISDTTSPYPHMLPSADVFKSAMSELGVNKDDTLVVYDTAELGIFSAPRVAWTLRVFGHPAVHILNNFRLWVEQGLPVKEGEAKPAERTSYPTPQLDKSKVVNFEDMKEVAKDHNKEGAEAVYILDARSRGRWQGTDPEPRPGLSSGHIPGSMSVPVPDLLDPETKAFLPAEELKQVFKDKGVDPSHPIISSCGTGVTATVIDAALMEAGYGDGSRRIYDGSWTEWAQRVKPSENLIKKVGA